MWEHPYFPQYYLPRAAFDASKISEGDKIKNDAGQHIATVWHITVGDKSTNRAICFQDNLDGPAKELSGLVKAASSFAFTK